MPIAAFALKKYFGWTRLSKTSDKEDTLTSLGESEKLSIQTSPRNTVPDVNQPAENKPEIQSFPYRVKSGNIFDE